MAWASYADRRGAGWNVDPDYVAHLLYGKAFSSYKRTHAHIVHPSSDIVGQTYRVEIPLHGASGHAREEANAAYAEFRRLLADDGHYALRYLVEARIQSARDEHHVQAMMAHAAHESSATLDRRVALGTGVVTVATPVRDFCATALLVGSTMLTGGASVLALGAGSVLTGTGTYESTGNIGTAAIVTLTSLVFGFVPIAGQLDAVAGAAAARTPTWLMLVGVHMDIVSGLMISVAQGTDMRQAVIGAFTSAGLGAITGHLSDSFFRRLTYPAAVLEAPQAAVRGAIDTARSRASDSAADAAVTYVLSSAAATAVQELPATQGALGVYAAAAAPAARHEELYSTSADDVRRLAMNPVTPEPPSALDGIVQSVWAGQRRR